MPKSDDIYDESDTEVIDPGSITTDVPQEGSQDDEVEKPNADS